MGVANIACELIGWEGRQAKSKFVLKCHLKFEYVSEMQRQFWNKFQTVPSILLRTNRIGHKFEVNGTVQTFEGYIREHRGHYQPLKIRRGW